MLYTLQQRLDGLKDLLIEGIGFHRIERGQATEAVSDVSALGTD